MATLLHPTAVIDPGAELGRDVEVGPYAVIGKHVRVGDGTTIGAHAIVDGYTTLGEKCRIFPSAAVGLEPQDLKYAGERTYLRIGDRTTIREFASLNVATSPEESTLVGSDCLIMAYSHVAHNCVVGNHVILANAATLAGHVTIEDYVTIGGVTPIHQFVRIGCHAFIGGGSRIPQDVAPYTLVAGNPVRLAGLNTVGLRRRGFSPETLEALEQAFRFIFRSRMLLADAVSAAREQVPPLEEVERFLEFIEASRRGITR